MPEFLARYEFKYLIDAHQEAWIREAVGMYAEPDSYGENGVYEVTSLYYDTWDWALAMQTVEGVRNRYKIRIRTYGFDGDMPVFAENKARVGTSICKSRALMHRRDWAPLSRRSPGPKEGYLAHKEDHQADLDSIRNLFDLLDLRPRLWVQYDREAYGSRYGDGARLTFDRSLRVQAPTEDHLDRPDTWGWQSVKLDGAPTILELKFNNAFPSWMQFIVDQLSLRRVSCSKYVQGAEQLGDVPWNRVEWREAWTVY